MNILAIGAHPDDIEILCSGTLAKYSQKGHKINLIRKCNPDVILTHYPQDYHTDHINLSKLVFESSYIVGIPKLKTNNKAMKKLPSLFFFDTIGGIDFNPTEYVDISEVMDQKIKMLKQHKSQLKFVKDLSNIDLIEMTEICSKFRGYQCNAKYAEGYIQSIAWPRNSTSRVLP